MCTSDKLVNRHTADALEQAGLASRAQMIATHLSHGEQRQLEIAMVLATQPRIILLDEPLAGMGQSEARKVVDLIASLKKGRAVLVVEHDMDAVFELADRLTVMAGWPRHRQRVAAGCARRSRGAPRVSGR